MNRLTKLIAVILMVLAACLAALAWWMGRQPPPAPAKTAAIETASYLTIATSRKLEKGRQITMEDVKLISSPTQISGAYQDVAGVIGRIPMTDMEADTLITESNLVHGMALKLVDGERAIAIPVDETVGVGNKIEAGDYVDVFFTLKPGNNIEKGQARLLASRVRVLAYGAAVVGEPPASGTLTATAQSSQTQARTAVLATSVEQINPLLLAVQNGKLTLALRHPGDSGTADVALFPQPDNVLLPKAGLSAVQKDALQSADNRAFSGIDLPSWAGSYGTHAYKTSAPGRTPSDPNRASGTLEVIKGTQREKISF